MKLFWWKWNSILAMAAAFAQRLLDAFVDAGLERQRCDFDEVRILRNRMTNGMNFNDSVGVTASGDRCNSLGSPCFSHCCILSVIFVFLCFMFFSLIACAFSVNVKAAGQMVISGDITRVVPIATLFAQYSLCADEAWHGPLAEKRR